MPIHRVGRHLRLLDCRIEFANAHFVWRERHYSRETPCCRAQEVWSASHGMGPLGARPGFICARGTPKLTTVGQRLQPTDHDPSLKFKPQHAAAPVAPAPCSAPAGSAGSVAASPRPCCGRRQTAPCGSMSSSWCRCRSDSWPPPSRR